MSADVVMDDNNPTQEGDNDSHTSHHEDDAGGWARAISLNPKYANKVLTGPFVEFGRRSTCGMHIRHPAVSGLHCTITNLGNGVIRLTDHSTNGTFVRGLAVGKGKSVSLNDGDEVILIKSQQEKVGYKIIILEANKMPPNAAEQKYKLGETLGNGAFAIVRRCADRSTGQAYAMKIIDKKKFSMIQQTSREGSLMDEVNILRAADHRGIIKLYDLIETESTLYLVLELVEGGDLFDRIVAQEGKGFSEDVARYMFEQMLSAMKYLHGRQIVHRDLKPENVLMVSKTGNEIRISDFGLSRVVGVGSFMKTMCGTPQYLAPEILLESHGGSKAPAGYDKAVDLWSLGCILYILLSGLAPFSSRADDPTHLQSLIKNGRFSFPNPQWSKVSDKAKDLVKALLTVDPARRMTIEQAEVHPWMAAGRASGGSQSTKRKDAPGELNGSVEKRRVVPASAAAGGVTTRPAAPGFDNTTADLAVTVQMNQ